MTRDETVALFEACEAKRREARAAALAEGKDEGGANAAGRGAAKAHWNAWAEGLLAERKAMESDGRWAAKEVWSGGLKPKNVEIQSWMDKAAADFSGCLFLVAGEVEQRIPSHEPPAKLIQLEGDYADFTGYIFPGKSSFVGATFSGNVIFQCIFSSAAHFVRVAFASATYFGSTSFSELSFFNGAAFSGVADFHSATFTGPADFESAAFSGAADFRHAAFNGAANFQKAAFAGYADFESTRFSGTAKFGIEGVSLTADFRLAGFKGDVRFGNVTFGGLTTFAKATFSGTARFINATFTSDARFGGATFSGTASFESATFTGEGRFGSANFQNFTSFRQAKFQKRGSFAGTKVEQAFDTRGAVFAQVPAFNQADFKQAPDLDDVEFPLPGFWRRGNRDLIPLYRAIRRLAIQGADYEREQMAFKGEVRSKRWTEHKPWHAAFWFGLAYDALSDFGRSIARPMAVWCTSVLAFAAIYFWNASVGVSEWGAACAGDGASKALKALTLSAANSLPLIGSSRGEVAREFYACLALPHAPAWSPILQIWQTLWSAVLLFLFLLALRNQFKIK